MRARPHRAPAALAAVGCVLVLAACGPAAAPTAGGSTSSSMAAPSPTTTTTTSAPSPSSTARATTTAAPRQARPGTEMLAPVPRAGAEPRVRFPANAAAVGAGANARVSTVPDAVWSRMVGYSWTPGCPVERSDLRYVTVNFWGFDGKRSRGAVVVHAAIANGTAQAFTRLYDQRFRIRQMRVMDRTWGHNPKGPGANDYAAMDADNTSAFNCRYVGGQEERKQYSNHAYGRAIDVNDWENPYRDEQGRIWPDQWFVTHRSPTAGVFAGSGSAAVRAFTGLGFHWGGLWAAPDYQHFEVSR
ncbi:MAG: M15 family metallopeptidase [Oryzihumus sp.]